MIRATRGLYIDMLGGHDGPRRGDQVKSPKTLYWVIHSRRVKRRDETKPPRYQMRVMRDQDIEPCLVGMLVQSALRNRGEVRTFDFEWYPREKKSMNFEQYMRLRD